MQSPDKWNGYRRRIILWGLERHPDNITMAAREIGVDRKYFSLFGAGDRYRSASRLPVTGVSRPSR